jgi:hypothetical protein
VKSFLALPSARESENYRKENFFEEEMTNNMGNILAYSERIKNLINCKK